MLLHRIITASLLLLVILGTLFFAPPWVWGVLSLALMAAGGWEWGSLIDPDRHPTRSAGRIAGAVVFGGLAYLAWRGEMGPVSAWFVGLVVIDLLLWAVVALPAVLSARLGSAQPIFAVLSMLCVWASIYELRLIHPVLVLSAMAIVWCADIGAYFIGRRFGRRKLAVRVSPGKSWEGAVGGLVMVLLVAALAWQLAPSASILSSILAGAVGLFPTALALTLIVALSVIGDLYESLLKRTKGVKDSGKMLPGHGGVLDRIDALIPTMPLCLLLWVALPS